MKRARDSACRRFILNNTSVLSPPNVPEIKLHLAHEAHALWHRTEEELSQLGLPPPYWAFAWAGGQGLARYVLDHPEIVAGKHVQDFAAGSGLVAIAAAIAGAREAVAVDIDPFSAAAVVMNAELNGVAVAFSEHRKAGTPDVILAGDIFYDREFAREALAYLSGRRREGCLVLTGDPGRSYLPSDHLVRLAEYSIAVTRELEDSEFKNTSVWQLADR